MNDQDAIARYIFLAKEKSALAANRKAMELKIDEARKLVGLGNKIRNESEKCLRKTINLMCDAEGEQKGLKQMMSDQAYQEIVKMLA